MNQKNEFNAFFSSQEFDDIKKIINQFNQDKDTELEISFPKGIGYEKYQYLLSYYTNIVNESKISAHDALDMTISLVNGPNLRISIVDADIIEKFIKDNSHRSNRDLILILSTLKPSSNIEVIHKDRDNAVKNYYNEWQTVVKLTTEKSVASIPKLSGNENILMRYKSRYTFHVDDTIKVDITRVRQSKSLFNLSKVNDVYEFEIEFIRHNIDTEIFINIFREMLTVVQQSEIPVSLSESQSIIDKYKLLLSIKNSTSLDVRNVSTLKPLHIVKHIPNKYALTDKADGERYFLFIVSEGIYLISNNLIVKKIKSDFTVADEFNNILIDGEYIISGGKKMFMAFDLVYAYNIDYRYSDKYTLRNRIDALENIIDKCFGTIIPFIDYTIENGNMELDAILKYYTVNLAEYWKKLKNQLATIKSNTTYITRKLYFFPYGIDPCEIFMYANMIWKLSSRDTNIPYHLDGMIYTPYNAPYMIKVNIDNADNIYAEYKWKPPSQNSIDFYIRFEKDAVTQQDALFYDNDTVYKICKLYVGHRNGKSEIPVPFIINDIEQTTQLTISPDYDEVTDINGDVINDDTVVEFFYDNTAATNLSLKTSWIPIRTRYDKTEAVKKYKTKYGNNAKIAKLIWYTIINPISEDDIAALASPESYPIEYDKFSRMINTKNQYYQRQKKITDATGMRAFNNWIKMNMITSYSRGKINALDIGCGVGGDLAKFVVAGIKEYVGLDIDANGLFMSRDSAMNRFRQMKNQQKITLNAKFIQADARALFNVESQVNAIPNMIVSNRRAINEFLSPNQKYDVINAQFTIHYYLSDDLSWSNFCKNIDANLAPGGYLLITAFDGKLLYDYLKRNKKMTVSYTDHSGVKNVFFDITKMYSDDTLENKTGVAIDFYNSLISNEGIYNKEYLVFPKFLESSLKEQIGLELVETDSFYNIFNLYKNYFTDDDASSEKKIKSEISYKKHSEIKKFYRSLDITNTTGVERELALASFKLSALNRYYVFRKNHTHDITKPSRIIRFNHQIDLGKIITPYFINERMIIDPYGRTSNINDIYHNVRLANPYIRPNVYLLDHNYKKYNVDGDDWYGDYFNYKKIKTPNTFCDKLMMIYKSPDKFYYPIYYQPNYYDGYTFDNIINNSVNVTPPVTKHYILSSNNIINDLDIFVNLTNQLLNLQ